MKYVLLSVGAVVVVAGLAFAWPDERETACREIVQASSAAVQRLSFTGRMDSADRKLFTDVVIGYAMAMRRSAGWSASTIESALKDQGSVRYLNNELNFMSPREADGLKVLYGEGSWSLSSGQVRGVLQLLQQRLPNAGICDDKY